MQLDFKIKNEDLIVNFDGELDHHTAKYARDTIDEQYSKSNVKNIIIDLNSLGFMDSSGIGLLMGRYKMVLERGGSVSLINVDSRVKKILEMSGILKILKILDEDAVDKL